MTVNLITTSTPEVFYNPVGSTTLVTVSLPSGVAVFSPVPRRPSVVEYKKRRHIVGQFSLPLIFTEFNTLFKSGITAPTVLPILTLNGGGAITTSRTPYYSFLHKVGTTLIHESDLSPAGVEVTATAQKFTWTLPATSPDSRVTHIRLYASDNGTLPRIVTDLTIGTVTYSDNTPTLALGATPQLSAGGITVQGNRGVPPYSRFIEMYHDRGWYAGNTLHPERIYFSEIGEPEAVGISSYISTRDGETVTGIRRLRDQLIIFCRTATYSIQGYSAADFVISKLSPSIGCLSHFAIVNIHNRLWFPSEDGVYTYDGSFKFQMEDLKTFWKDDFKIHKGEYLRCIAIDDRETQVYKLLIPKDVPPLSFYYIGAYTDLEPETGGGAGQPYWTIDQRNRRDSTLGYASDGNANEVVTGNCDGWMRRENVDGDADDDGDTLGKHLTIRHGHNLMSDPMGDDEEGKIFKPLYTSVESEFNAWILYALGGDEQAYLQIRPDNIKFFWKDSVAASYFTQNIDDVLYTYIPQTIHWHYPERVSGRGLTVEIQATAPIRMKYRGFGGVFGPGPASRPPSAQEAVPEEEEP